MKTIKIIIVVVFMIMLQGCDISGLDRERAELLGERQQLLKQIVHAERMIADIDSRAANAALRYVEFILVKLGLGK